MAEPQTQVRAARRAGRRRAQRTGRAIGVIGIPGDRRDEDQREYGAIAAGAFDEIIVREDKNLRGRAPGETAANVARGRAVGQGGGHGAAPRRSTRSSRRWRRSGPRCAGRSRATSSSCCVGRRVGVYREAMALAGRARAARPSRTRASSRRPRGSGEVGATRSGPRTYWRRSSASRGESCAMPSVVASTWRAPSLSSSANTASRSAWQNRMRRAGRPSGRRSRPPRPSPRARPRGPRPRPRRRGPSPGPCPLPRRRRGSCR